jgi:hypothetical protein
VPFPAIACISAVATIDCRGDPLPVPGGLPAGFAVMVQMHEAQKLADDAARVRHKEPT